MREVAFVNALVVGELGIPVATKLFEDSLRYALYDVAVYGP